MQPCHGCVNGHSPPRFIMRVWGANQRTAVAGHVTTAAVRLSRGRGEVVAATFKAMIVEVMLQQDEAGLNGGVPSKPPLAPVFSKKMKSSSAPSAPVVLAKCNEILTGSLVMVC
eukprot:CAMPEP_0182561176 /NCGR_PEP_ID=MMETSP1324-20130603/3711_1 /TAXON_ID=236786 /ORGANISM="Florenciella sp., Strain RCC1587" /LENGTH=113 /DNA_ID=CAMNT_0024773723 /DNA_START=482 /DNA_END=824 /DNA_ORIENTATION=+